MNSERFNSALNEISDDLINAAAGAYEKKANRKKTFIRVAWAACAVLVLTAIGLFWNAPTGVTNPTQPTISIQNPTTAPTQPEQTEPTQELPAYTGQVYFLNATKDGTDLTPMQANMTLPVNCMFRVRSLQGMTESEAENAIEEEKAFKDAFKEKYGNSDGGRYEYYQSDEAIIQHLSGGKASLILTDATRVENVELETLGVLRVGGGHGTYNRDVTIGEGESAVTIPAGCLRVYLHYGMSNETSKFFEENPETPLSTLRDTITVTINYKNGTKEIVVIDVTLDDDGHVYMTQRGDNIGV